MAPVTRLQSKKLAAAAASSFESSDSTTPTAAAPAAAKITKSGRSGNKSKSTTPAPAASRIAKSGNDKRKGKGKGRDLRPSKIVVLKIPDLGAYLHWRKRQAVKAEVLGYLEGLAGVLNAKVQRERDDVDACRRTADRFHAAACYEGKGQQACMYFDQVMAFGSATWAAAGGEARWVLEEVVQPMYQLACEQEW